MSGEVTDISLQSKKPRHGNVNRITAEQVSLACRHVSELLDAGVSENLAIRTLELFVDVYAKLHHGGSATPHHVSQVRLWSKAARDFMVCNPDAKPKDCLRVEHGTPRRELARLAMKSFSAGKLDRPFLDELVKTYWKLAVITLEEDLRLNAIARSKMFASPEARWAAAGIIFE